MDGKWTQRLAVGSVLMLPVAVAAAWAAGAISARRYLRRETERTREPEPVSAPPKVEIALPPPVPEPVVREEVVDDATLAVLSAAVAAFFGKTARIRRARLIAGAPASSAWAQQGRVYVQGSHNLGLRQRP